MNHFDPQLAETFLKYNDAYVHRQTEDALVLMQRASGTALALGDVRPEDIPADCISLGLDSEELFRALGETGWYREYLVFRIAYYLRGLPDSCLPEGTSVRRMTYADIPFLLEHYHEPGVDENYIRHALDRGMLAIMKDGETAGFIGIHDEGSMGMLVILPEYRHRHYAEALETEMIRYMLQNGHFIYCQIETDNQASQNLQNKLGMTWDERIMYWLFR